MRRSADWTQYVLDLPMRSNPGEAFDYCNGASFLVSAIIEKATGVTALDYAKTHLFAPLGIADVKWPADPGGVTVGYGEMWLKPRDMAKFGWLYLNRGRWAGRQIVSRAWVEQSTRARIDATLFPKYGYQWWHGGGDYYAAVGYRGQFIFIVPAQNMVVVFTSDLPSGDLYVPRDRVTDSIIPAVKSEAALLANPAQFERLSNLVLEAGGNHGAYWSSKPEGKAQHGMFVRRAEPAFQFRVPRGSRRETLQTPFQIMRMKTLSGFQFAAAVGDIPDGVTLKHVGPQIYAPFLRSAGRSAPKVVSNQSITLNDGTPAYRTEIHWRNRLPLDFKTVVVSAFKDGKWVFVEAHPWKDHDEAAAIVGSLSFHVSDQ